MTRRWWGLVLGLTLAGCAAHVLPAIHSEGERLRVARQMRDQGHYADAIELLKTYITNAAGSASVDDAVYLLGDTYLKQKEWASAQAEFERLLRDYPESDSAGSASFRLGEALAGQSRGSDFDQDFTVKALDQWQTYLRDYPDHWLRPEAQRKVEKAKGRLADKDLKNADLYLKLKLYKPARVYYQKILDDYPDAPAAMHARVGLAICDAHQGRRAEAIQQLRDIESRYAGQAIAARAARERKRLERARRPSGRSRVAGLAGMIRRP